MTSQTSMIFCAAFLLLSALSVANSQPVPAPYNSVYVPPVLADDLVLGNYSTITTNNKLFLPPPNGTSYRALCNIGPSVWCQSEANQKVCGVYNKTISSCGYASTLGNCTTMSMTEFCANATLKPLTYNGGINGAPQGHLGLFVLALYWAPASCPSDSPGPSGFCSQYTMAGNPAATNLMLHGLWPDTGSLYVTDPQPPLYSGAYQGWTQYCNGSDGDYYQCSVNGGLCTWSNSTSPYFSQSDYESCMRANNVTQCQVEESTVQALLPQFKRYAPGYLGTDRTFLDHEYMKHASCIGGYLTRNKTAFFERAVQWTAAITTPGANAAADLVQNNVGKNVTIASLLTAMGRQGNPQCVTQNGLCVLSQLYYCMGVDASGFPTQLIDCPSGSQLGTCDASKCANGTVLIPSYSASASSTGAASYGKL